MPPADIRFQSKHPHTETPTNRLKLHTIPPIKMRSRPSPQLVTRIDELHTKLIEKVANPHLRFEGVPINRKILQYLESIRSHHDFIDPRHKGLSDLYLQIEQLVRSWGDDGNLTDRDRMQLQDLDNSVRDKYLADRGEWGNTIWRYLVRKPF